MPQFDQFSFFNQVSWFIFFFLNFYFLISYFFLPKICYNIKFRKKKIISNINKRIPLNLEKKNKIYYLNNLYQNLYVNFEFFIKKNIFIYKINQFQYLLENSLTNNKYNQYLFLLLNNKFILSKKILLKI